MTKSQTFTYQGSFARQRDEPSAPRFFLFQAPASDVLKWAFVDRLEPGNSKGVQRSSNPRRINEVTKFLKAYDYNVIPTAVVIAFRSFAKISEKDATGDLSNGGLPDASENISSCMGYLEFNSPQDCNNESSMVAVVIDGQHRLLGMENYSADTPVNVVAMLGADENEIAFQFLVINNKVQKVDKKHLKNLSLRYEENKLDERLKHSAKLGVGERSVSLLQIAAFDQDSPFFQIVDMPECQQKWVVPNALESAYDYLVTYIHELDEEDRIWAFLYMWKEIKETWSQKYPTIWVKEKEDRRLLSKVAVICFTEYIVQTLSALSTVTDAEFDLRMEDQVRKLTRKIIDVFDPEFFLTDWVKKELDTKTGRMMVSESIRIVASNVKTKSPWYQDVPLVAQSRLL